MAKRTQQIIDKPCKRCGIQPALYYVFEEFTRGYCVSCEKAEHKTKWAMQEAKVAHLPRRATLDRPCKKCGECPGEYQRHSGGKDNYRATCMKCQNLHHADFRRDNPEKVKKAVRDSHQVRRIRFREEMLAHYGRFCACCGESNPVFLTLDHPENNGAAERRELKKLSGFMFYEYLSKKGWPAGYRVLCWNCNCGRQWNAANPGICPHEEERLRLVA